jgi:hypothetical protein
VLAVLVPIVPGSACEEEFGTPASVASGSPSVATGCPEGAEDGGLGFVCIDADFQRRLEVVHAQWCDDGNAFGLGNDKA